MNVPANYKYSNDHEWLRVEGEEGYVGITAYATEQLGDIVFLDINSTGDTLAKGEAFGTVEAVKTVSDIFMPVSGEVLDFNPELETNPGLLNTSPYEDGWIIKIKITNPEEINQLLDAVQYEKLIEE
jgi:glycine cleavage system H protein